MKLKELIGEYLICALGLMLFPVFVVYLVLNRKHLKGEVKALGVGKAVLNHSYQIGILVLGIFCFVLGFFIKFKCKRKGP